jgi:hypothetical protein
MRDLHAFSLRVTYRDHAGRTRQRDVQVEAVDYQSARRVAFFKARQWADCATALGVSE